MSSWMTRLGVGGGRKVGQASRLSLNLTTLMLDASETPGRARQTSGVGVKKSETGATPVLLLAPASAHREKRDAFIPLVAPHALRARVEARLAVHHEDILVVAVTQRHVRQPGAVHLALQRVRGGVPAIEVAHDADLFRLRRGAKKADGLGDFLGRVRTGFFARRSFLERHGQRCQFPRQPDIRARPSEGCRAKRNQTLPAKASMKRRGRKTRAYHSVSPLSFAPGFSRVWRRVRCHSRFNGFSGLRSRGSSVQKPLKRLCPLAPQDTRLKPGANERANRLQETEQHLRHVRR